MKYDELLGVMYGNGVRAAFVSMSHGDQGTYGLSYGGVVIRDAMVMAGEDIDELDTARVCVLMDTYQLGVMEATNYVRYITMDGGQQPTRLADFYRAMTENAITIALRAGQSPIITVEGK